MTTAYVKQIGPAPVEGYTEVDIIMFSAGTPPPRPHPEPPLGIWGPGDPRPTLPIAGWDPGTGAWPKPPTTGVPPGTQVALIAPVPPPADGSPPPAPPVLNPNAKSFMVKLASGETFTAWSDPYPSTGPVAPPA